MAILAADIGGTNTRIGIFMGGRAVKVFESKTNDLPPKDALIAAALWAKRKGLIIGSACVAIAGPIENGKARMVNASHSLSLEDIRKILGTKNVSLINDFEAVAFGINALQKSDTVPLTKSNGKEHALKAVIGAGTGLGKALLRYDEKSGIYLPLPSEEGHAQLPIAREEEFSLLKFIQRKKKREIVYWEDVLSGSGIVTLYEFSRESLHGKIPIEKIDKVKKFIGRSKDQAAAIASLKAKDPSCKKAFELFSRFLARFAKSTALANLPYGGIYIAGGIAIKNSDILFSSEFKKEWSSTKEWNDLLGKIPLFAIKDRNIGLRGAAFRAERGGSN